MIDTALTESKNLKILKKDLFDKKGDPLDQKGFESLLKNRGIGLLKQTLQKLFENKLEKEKLKPCKSAAVDLHTILQAIVDLFYVEFDTDYQTTWNNLKNKDFSQLPNNFEIEIGIRFKIKR